MLLYVDKYATLFRVIILIRDHVLIGFCFNIFIKEIFLLHDHPFLRPLSTFKTLKEYNDDKN